MAKLEGSAFGNFSGRVGNLSARIKNGETIISARPKEFNVSQSPGAVKGRNRFSVCSRIAKTVSDIDDLNKIWDKIREAGLTVYNTVIQRNYQFADPGKPTAENIITPGGFDLAVDSMAVTEERITVNLAPLRSKTDFNDDEKELIIFMIITGFDPVDENDNYYIVMPFTYTEADFDPDDKLEALVNFDRFTRNKLAGYNGKVLLVCTATKDDEGNLVKYSATYGREVGGQKSEV